MADTAKSKPALSQRLMGMKFMQRAKEKAEAQQAQEQPPKPEPDKGDGTGPSEAQPASDTGTAGPSGSAPPPRCIIIYDSTPLPNGISQGRRSFGPKPVAPEKDEQGLDASATTGAQKIQGTDVTDVEMAQRLIKQFSPPGQGKPKDRPKPAQAEGEFVSLRDRKRSKRG